jgi:hypothetical protein
MTDKNFSYRVVFFHQKSCVACRTMEPIWNKVKAEIAEEYSYLNIGFGDWDVNDDNWEFIDMIGGDGTPNFAVFNEESELLGLNTEGMLPESKLKDFILASINKYEEN